MRFTVLISLLFCTALARAAEPHPSLPKPVISECLGVNIHFTDPKPGEMEMIAAAGFKWVRMDLTWAATERKKGEYDFSAYDRLAAALEKHRLRAVFILDYGNALYAEVGDKHPFTSRAGTEEFRAAFARWAVAAVGHFKGRGYLWEMWNEPNHSGFWKPKPDAEQYTALARATGDALRAAGLLGPKGEAFIGPATSTVDLPFIEACGRAGLFEYWDAISVHPYRQTAPETVGVEYRALRQLIDKYAPKGKTIPIVSGEWGYSTAWKGFDDEKQAKYAVRQLLTNIANGIPLSIWYDWRDDGDDSKEAEHRFGLVRRKYRENEQPVFEPKPSYLAVQKLQSPDVAALLKLGVLEPVVQEMPLRGVHSWRGLGGPEWKVTADGDAAVKSSQTLAIQSPTPVPPPPGYGGQDMGTLKYEFEAGWKFIRVTAARNIPALLPDDATPARAMGLWVYGDAHGCQLRIRFVDSTGQVFQADGKKIDWAGWRYVSFPLVASEASPLTHWGGANDGKIHPPMKWDTLLLLDNVSRQPVAGEIHFYGPSLIY